VRSIKIREGSIKGRKGTLVEVGEEELLVEEDTNRLSVTIVMNLDTWLVISRICVQSAHTAENYIT
jgi:hypothetical protein